MHEAITAAALRAVKAHHHEAINASDIARMVSLSAGVLQKRFRRKFGASIADALKGVRLDRSRDLLIQTNLAGSEIAGRTRFQSQTYFGRVFRQEESMTPGQYRAKHS